MQYFAASRNEHLSHLEIIKKLLVKKESKTNICRVLIKNCYVDCELK